MKKESVIALLGQPNSGKSTLFNALTGARQRIGNWPGKTVEKKEGYFTYNNYKYMVADLPGSYSLSANSEEEIVTRDYISSGKADVVCIIADASQLERSLFMLADYTGINTPAILLLNMIDVAKDKKIQIDAQKIQERIGIPVIPFIAADSKGYDTFYKAIEGAINNPKLIKVDGINDLFSNVPNNLYENICQLIPSKGIDHYSKEWLAVKALEGDELVINSVKEIIPTESVKKLDQILTQNSDGNLYSGDCKFSWIDSALEGAINRTGEQTATLSKFDRIATSRRWGKFVAVLIMLGGLILSFIPAAPFMGIGTLISGTLSPAITSGLLDIGVSSTIVSFIAGTIINTIGFATSMVGFVFGVTLVFGFFEELGYMARISYAFDSTMSKLGLQGKSIMPLLISVGCTIGGAAGAKVIDSWGQRMLTIALAWAVPCAAIFAIIPTLSAMFFGMGGAMIIMVVIFAITILHISITAKVFGRILSPVSERHGMIMELPPYHKPKAKPLLRYVFNRSSSIFWRALKLIFVVSVIFWVLSYSPGGAIENSVIYKIGTFIEPVTSQIGLGWQTFMAFIASGFGKEAVLGVLSALYTGSGDIYAASVGGVAATENIGGILSSAIPPAEALAFIFAVTFNVPCLIAMASTYQVSGSIKWTVITAIYYVCVALVICFIVYHIGLLIF